MTPEIPVHRDLDELEDQCCKGYGQPAYIHTAIAYTNGSPHIGHAYEFITAAFFARYHRIFGRKTYLCVGTDEHGVKIAKTAEAQGVEPIKVCDRYQAEFAQLWKDLNIENDYAVRTTSEHHKKTAQIVWKKCLDQGDIYFSRYEGWYDERAEAYIIESQAALTDYKDLDGVAYKRVSEDTYFFRLSKYQARVMEHLSNPSHAVPDRYRQQALEFCRGGLDDISISRHVDKMNWGVPVPDNPEHVMYVWFDALVNYLTNVDFQFDSQRNHDTPTHVPNWAEPHKPHAVPRDEKFGTFWEEPWSNPHARFNCIVGKDITRFHLIIWPAMLMSCQLPPARCLSTHGFISAGDGRKMSKSLGNVVEPGLLLQKYSTDSIYFYLLQVTPFGDDLKFSIPGLEAAHNGILADVYGNLFNRGANLCAKYCDGVVGPEDLVDMDKPFSISTLRAKCERAVELGESHTYVELVNDAARATNRWLAAVEPWKIPDEKSEERAKIIKLTLESCWTLAVFMIPFAPLAGEKAIEEIFAGHRVAIAKMANDFLNLPVGLCVSQRIILFPKIEEPKVKQDFAHQKAIKKAKQELQRAKQTAKEEERNKCKGSEL